MQIITRHQIDQILPTLDLIPTIEKGFQAYSEGAAIVPPVGEMILEQGEVHIKYGYIREQNYYVIKIASGFYENPGSTQMSGNGMMLLFSQKSGQPICALLDEGHLTNIRTAVAGAIVAKHLAPENVKMIGIVGAGAQARLQLIYLKNVVACRQVMVWGTGPEELERYKSEMEQEGFIIETTQDLSRLQNQCNLIVSTTPSKVPLLNREKLKKGTHITAIGSDTPEKQELDPEILQQADLVVADSLEQCMERGEIYKAMAADMLDPQKVVELGDIISGKATGRLNDEQISVADLTGVAVQDIAIATAVFNANPGL